jgi:hypothetical protein
MRVGISCKRLGIPEVDTEQRNPEAPERRKVESQISWTLPDIGKGGISII